MGLGSLTKHALNFSRNWRNMKFSSTKVKKGRKKGEKRLNSRPRLHEIGSKWIRTQTVTDRPCVYTGPDGSEPIWICYLFSNGITFESDPIRLRSQKGLAQTVGIGSKLVRIGSETIKLKSFIDISKRGIRDETESIRVQNFKGSD